MLSTTGPRTARRRLRVGVLSGVILLAIGSTAGVVHGSDGHQPRPGAAPARSTTGVLDDRTQASRSWHPATTGVGPTSARAAEWADAISPSPHLSRSQVDAMTPRQVVDATLHDVVRRQGTKAAKGAASLARAAGRGRRTAFRITTFNVLGSQHTAPGGDAVSYAPGRIRTQWQSDYLSSIRSSIVGMQEIQADQVENLNLTTSGQFSFWPGEALGAAGVPQTMMWQTSLWKPKALDYIVVPFMGGTRPQPVVLLKNRKTRQKIYVLNIHNSPKDAKGRQRERDKAVSIEKTAVRKLRKSGYPVFIVGDFNEHKTAFCKMTSRTGLEAANGGSHPRKGSCRPPAAMRVDWVFGSRDVAFSKFQADQGPIVQRITDHAVVTVKVVMHS